MEWAKRLPAKARVGALLLALSLSLTFVAYGRILSFPFMFDDLIHLRWLQGRGVFEGWAFAKGLQHYRPLVLSIWAASARLFGAQNAWPLHLLSLLLHVGNACLVGWLAYQLTPRAETAVAATVLFTTFPFSYQAIPSPGSQSKPLSTFLILLACLLYWQGRSRQSRPLVAASVVPAALAPFAYQAAVTIGGYILLMEFLLWRKGVIDRPSPWSALFALIGPLFVVIWALVPSSADPALFPGWEALWQSSIYFLQAMTWPLSLFARPIMAWTGLRDQTVTAMVAYPSFALLVLLLLRRRHTEAIMASVTFFCLGLIVQWVALPFQHVIDGPRMLYTASVGVALLWADLLTTARTAPRPRSIRVLAALALVAMMIWSLAFIIERMDLCQIGLSVLSEASAKVVQAPPKEVQLFINIPSWLVPRERGFALGHEGYLLLPSYTGVGLDDFVYINTGAKRDVWVGSLPNTRREWKALIGYYAPEGSREALTDQIRRAGRVWVLGYPGDSLEIVEAGSVRAAPSAGETGEDALLAVFVEAVALDKIAPEWAETELTVDVDWRSLQVLNEPYTVFLHLYSDDGRLVAQADGLPLGGAWPLPLWEPGDIVRDVRHVELPEGLAPGEYTIGLGLYRSDTGQRAPAIDQHGDPLPEGMYRSRVTSP